MEASLTNASILKVLSDHTPFAPIDVSVDGLSMDPSVTTYLSHTHRELIGFGAASEEDGAAFRLSSNTREYARNSTPPGDSPERASALWFANVYLGVRKVAADTRGNTFWTFRPRSR